jgi:hypothetical protein
MFVEMLLALFALVIAGIDLCFSNRIRGGVSKGAGVVWSARVSKFLGALGLPAGVGASYGSVMMILAVTILQLVVRFMRLLLQVAR